ncbi:type II toxin-antitoxin system RelE/ParE family toxin [Phenylobacterium sp.]|uniref:type II toxin-antitoxin system RelE/ParE family toxin n=1 Tax=Phenylobacterium sp. TaxID=1871053 RepID=UPI00374CD011
MKRLGFAPEAVADLREIALYIADDSPQRALTFVAELEQKAMDAASRPLAFRERADISPGLRAISHGRYLIFFRDLVDEVRIVRVVHGARDLPRLFDPSSQG